VPSTARSAQLVLPFSGNVLLLGGDNWIASSGLANNRGNNDSVIFTSAGRDHLVPGADMNRRRWYATATTLASGDVYVQGGRDGADQAEVRSGATGSFRPLTGFSTSKLGWYYPRNWLAPDGKIFGTTGRTMYRVDPSGSGSLTLLGTTPFSGPSGVTSSEVMYAPGKILRTVAAPSTPSSRSLGGAPASPSTSAAPRPRSAWSSRCRSACTGTRRR
jgi:hypothetical protein